MEQLLLNIELPVQKTFDNFIVGNNKECFDSLKIELKNLSHPHAQFLHSTERVEHEYH